MIRRLPIPNTLLNMFAATTDISNDDESMSQKKNASDRHEENAELGDNAWSEDSPEEDDQCTSQWSIFVHFAL